MHYYDIVNINLLHSLVFVFARIIGHPLDFDATVTVRLWGTQGEGGKDLTLGMRPFPR